ncbi:cupin domain-containing protein [Bradyrhizobium sacchari]|uniref:Cupin domain n=1 Tax=Bradyrhizobium sacchari TaxID=1399419 RepID=A0A560HX31_9BRAD|nr:cupin domain-containing protein [Bradyrhizobium sacchari]TWB51198.1 cupin domain [Bradyrhizobium sacchari]TWB69432.1 cupin domain [Bradyrhizobium sacchari]
MKNQAVANKNVSMIEGKEKPFVVKWDERRANWDSSLRPEKVGWQRAMLDPGVGGASFRMMALALPFGRSRPFHITPGAELFIFVLEGEMEWGIGPNVNNLEWFRLGKYDSLFVPNGFGTDYRNSGQVDAKYLVGFGRVGDNWPNTILWQLEGDDEPRAYDFKAWESVGKGK